jgi:hypothetical protein
MAPWRITSSSTRFRQHQRFDTGTNGNDNRHEREEQDEIVLVL